MPGLFFGRTVEGVAWRWPISRVGSCEGGMTFSREAHTSVSRTFFLFYFQSRILFSSETVTYVRTRGGGMPLKPTNRRRRRRHPTRRRGVISTTTIKLKGFVFPNRFEFNLPKSSLSSIIPIDHRRRRHSIGGHLAKKIRGLVTQPRILAKKQNCRAQKRFWGQKSIF